MVLSSPSKLGNAYDIDLLLLLKSSRLINSFPTPLPTMKRISLAVYAQQQLKLKGKFNALIGDAPTDDNLQMWAFSAKEDSKDNSTHGYMKSIFFICFVIVAMWEIISSKYK